MTAYECWATCTDTRSTHTIIAHTHIHVKRSHDNDNNNDNDIHDNDFDYDNNDNVDVESKLVHAYTTYRPNERFGRCFKPSLHVTSIIGLYYVNINYYHL